MIVAFAGPVLNPRPQAGTGPLVVLLDGGWGDAPDWPARMGRVAGALEEAARNGSALELTRLVDQFYAEVQAMGGNRWDTSSLITRLK